MKILIVDDDVVARMVLMHLIDSCGRFDIVEAEDGADAWQQLEGGLRPALCFSDLRMPRLSGMQLLARVKTEPALESMPFVLVSSAAERATVRQAGAAGAAGYIVKPFQAEEVRAHLAALTVPAAGAHAHLAVSPAEAASACPSPAEAPRATQQRLGIGVDRLLVYLGGFQQQLGTAGAELDALIARGDTSQAHARIERLHAACVTLGLHAAGAALRTAPGPLSGAAVRSALADVLRAVVFQAALVRREGSNAWETSG